MSVSKVSNYPQVAESKEAQTQENPTPGEVGYHLVKTNINFLKESFILEGWHPQKYSAPTPVNIHSYTDVEELKKFKFFSNGFEYHEAEDPLYSAIQKFAQARLTNQSPILEQTQLIFEVEQFLSAWGKENGVSGTPVAVDIGYRDSLVAQAQLAPFAFVHVDTCKKNIENPCSIEGKTYKQGVEKKFGPMSTQEYIKKVIHYRSVSVWIALHDKKSKSGLGVFNIEAIKNLSEKLIPVTITGGVLIHSLHPTPEAVVITKHEQTIEDKLVLIFDTSRTPHTALEIEGGHRGARRSIELRFAFVEIINQAAVNI